MNSLKLLFRGVDTSNGAVVKMLALSSVLLALSLADQGGKGTFLLTRFSGVHGVGNCIKNEQSSSKPWYVTSDIKQSLEQYGFDIDAPEVMQYTLGECGIYDITMGNCKASMSGATEYLDIWRNTTIPSRLTLSFTDSCYLRISAENDEGFITEFSPAHVSFSGNKIFCYMGPTQRKLVDDDGLIDFVTLTFVDLASDLRGFCYSQLVANPTSVSTATANSSNTTNPQQFSVSTSGIKNFCDEYGHPIDSMSNGTGFSCSGNDGQDSQVYTWFLGLFAFVVFAWFCCINARDNYTFVRALCSLCFSRSNETSTQGVVTYKPVQQ